MRLFLVFVVLALPLLSAAHDPSENCSKAMTHEAGPTRFIPSGINAEAAPTYLDDIRIIFGPEGVARKLGYALPAHVLEEVPPRELAVLASLGRHPIRHWVDGAKLINGVRRAAGVYEFVTPGNAVCPTCRSFYNAAVPQEPQRLIMMHVAGHNDVSHYSLHNQIRGTDPIAESIALNKLLHP